MLCEVCSLKIVKQVYYALVESRLSYGFARWGGTYTSTIKPIILVQKYFVRVMENKCRIESSWPLFIHLKIFSAEKFIIF